MRRFKKAIRFLELRNLFVFAVLFGMLHLVCLPTGFAADNKMSTDEQLLAMKERLDRIEANQKTMLEHQDEILDRLKELKIWVRRM